MHLYHQEEARERSGIFSASSARGAFHVGHYVRRVNERRKGKQRVEENTAKLSELAEILEIRPFDKKAVIAYGDI